jgi:hypothetical protein
VILVRVGQDHDVDAPVPRREALVERLEQAIRIRPAVDHHPAALFPFHEDGVALADVEHRHPHRWVRLVGDREPEGDGRAGERESGKAAGSRGRSAAATRRLRRTAARDRPAAARRT